MPDGTSRNAQRTADPWKGLTRRQRQVASLAAAGLTNQEIAERLCISRHTVRYHLVRVFKVMGIHSRWQLRDRAVRK